MDSTGLATDGQTDDEFTVGDDGELRERLARNEAQLTTAHGALERLQGASSATARFVTEGVSTATDWQGLAESLCLTCVEYLMSAVDLPEAHRAGVLFRENSMHVPPGSCVGEIPAAVIEELAAHATDFAVTATTASDGTSYATIPILSPAGDLEHVAQLAIELPAPDPLPDYVNAVLRALTTIAALQLDRIAHVTEARFEAEHAQAAARIQLRLVNPIQRDAAMHVAIEELMRCSSVSAVAAVDVTTDVPRIVDQFGELSVDEIAKARGDQDQARANRWLTLPIVIDGVEEALLAVQAVPGVNLGGDNMFAGIAAAIIGSVSRFRAATTIDLLRRTTTRQLVEAQERDRAIVAADIHDGTLQQLGATAMRLELVRAHVDAGDAAAVNELVDRCAAEIRSCTKELRNLLMELRPQVLDDNGLAAALGELGRAAEGVEVHISVSLPPRLDDDFAITIFRIVQEALNNVRKHARAANAYVEVSHTDRAVLVEVRDDGVGFEGAASGPSTSGQHFGLLGMRERARMLGGEFSIVGHSGGGTIISAVLPLGGRAGNNGAPA